MPRYRSRRQSYHTILLLTLEENQKFFQPRTIYIYIYTHSRIIIFFYSVNSLGRPELDLLLFTIFPISLHDFLSLRRIVSRSYFCVSHFFILNIIPHTFTLMGRRLDIDWTSLKTLSRLVTVFTFLAKMYKNYQQRISYQPSTTFEQTFAIY